uniref:Endoribonuclease n=1 Tax=Parascaris equorum TaxID=6256 RepID=A0A914RPN8_PAREQ
LKVRFQEKSEISQFLDAVFATKVWRTLYSFLHKKDHPFARNEAVFRFWISQLWFVRYSRARGLADTSGFEHVFMGEDVMAAVKFTWMNELKRSGSFVIGSSPEFDLALYTLCFLSRRGRNTCDVCIYVIRSPSFQYLLYRNVEIDGCPMHITSYEIVQQRKVFIGTIYPTAGRITDACRRFNG